MKGLFAVTALILLFLVPVEPAISKDIGALKECLPKDAELIKPNRPRGASSIQKYDFDQDGVEELLLSYRRTSETKRIHFIMLKKENDEWRKIYEHVDKGYDIDFSGLIDLDQDSRPEFLLSRRTGALGGDKLEVYEWKEGKLSRLGGPVNYHFMEFIHDGDRAGIAIWERLTGDAFIVKAVSMESGRLVEDRRLFSSYYPKVEAYYTGKLRKKNSWSYWFALADAQLRAGKLHDAEESIIQGEAHGRGTKEFMQLRSKLLNEKGGAAEN